MSLCQAAIHEHVWCKVSGVAETKHCVDLSRLTRASLPTNLEEVGEYLGTVIPDHPFHDSMPKIFSPKVAQSQDITIIHT